jgi:Tol biopolymer transport system component
MDVRTRGKSGAGRRLALVAAALALATGAEGAQAAFPGTNGRIAFGVAKWRLPVPCPRDVPHGCEPELVSSSIETVLPSGRGRRVLRRFPVGQGVAGQSGPVWSPSGRLLAFQQESRLAIIRRDGTGLRRLPQLTNGDADPTWSPNGRRLAFAGRSLCCNWLYTVRRDGTAVRRVIAQEARWPAWSTTGAIAFVNYNDQGRTPVGLKDGLYTIRPDGTRRRRLFGRFWGTGAQPDWSPDGSRIAFHARKHIFTMEASGGRLARLTSGKDPRGEGSSDPAWSPDGESIAFIRDDDIYVMRANGRGVRRLVDAADQDLDHPERAWAELSGPTWQPLPR